MPRITAIAALSLSLLLSPPTTAHVFGRTPLVGDVRGEILSGEYIVTSPVTVRTGDTLRVRAGAAIYFEQLAGIVVSGALSIEGTQDYPVKLLLADGTGGSGGGKPDDDDDDTAPAAEQGVGWNGIETAGTSASVSLRHVVIGECVYGVNVKDHGARVDLADVNFHGIGYAAVMIAGQEIPLNLALPVNILWDMSARLQPVPDTPLFVPAHIGDDADAARHKHKKRKALCAGALGVAATGIVIYSVNLKQGSDNFDRYARESDPRERSVHKSSFRRNRTMGAVGAALAGAGLLCVGATVFF